MGRAYFPEPAGSRKSAPSQFSQARRRQHERRVAVVDVVGPVTRALGLHRAARIADRMCRAVARRAAPGTGWSRTRAPHRLPPASACRGSWRHRRPGTPRRGSSTAAASPAASRRTTRGRAAPHPRRFAGVEEHQRRQVADAVEIDATQDLVAGAEQSALARAVRVEITVAREMQHVEPARAQQSAQPVARGLGTGERLDLGTVLGEERQQRSTFRGGARKVLGGIHDQQHAQPLTGNARLAPACNRQVLARIPAAHTLLERRPARVDAHRFPRHA